MFIPTSRLQRDIIPVQPIADFYRHSELNRRAKEPVKLRFGKHNDMEPLSAAVGNRSVTTHVLKFCQDRLRLATFKSQFFADFSEARNRRNRSSQQ
jgi:hypothetical protein